LPVAPFRVFGQTTCFTTLPLLCILSELAVRSECRDRRSSVLIGSTHPLCRWPFPRLCGFPSSACAEDSYATSRRRSSDLAFLQSYIVRPSSPTVAGKLLSGAFVPFSTSGLGGPPYAGLPCPLRSALRVWLPSRRFAPSKVRAGLISYRQRSWDSPCGASSSRKVSGAFLPGSTHMPFFPSVFPSAGADRPAQRAAASGLLPFRESLTTRRGVSASIAGGSLGLHPSKAYRQRPGPGFHPNSSHTLRCSKSYD
jgi:hypothetical protein